MRRDPGAPARRHFGTASGGAPVEELTLTSGALTARILSWGAVLRDLRLDAVEHPLALGLNAIEDYEAHSPFFGAVVGRFANRIAGGRFPLDGREVLLDRNEGANHLHGGAASFGRRPWRVVEALADAVRLELVSEDGESGYPGRLTASCLYRVEAPASLIVELEATADAPTVANLVHHAYFNLDGRDDISAHALEIAAERTTETGPGTIPTGRLLPVAGTERDFRAPRAPVADGVAYDDNFVLADAPRAAPAFAARLTGATGVSMALRTTAPGLQFYDAAKLACPVPGLDDRRYAPRAGLCLEPQLWPDAPNHPHFPSAVLRPGEVWRQRTEYVFSTA